MALEINKANLIEKGAISPGSSGGGDWIGGIDKLLSSLDKTANTMAKLLNSYSELKNKIIPAKGIVAPSGGGVQRQPTPHTPPPPSIQPALKQPVEKEEVKTEDKLEKATNLFNELHEMVKPYIPQAKLVSASVVIQHALKPENKKKIIEQIASRL